MAPRSERRSTWNATVANSDHKRAANHSSTSGSSSIDECDTINDITHRTNTATRSGRNALTEWSPPILHSFAHDIEIEADVVPDLHEFDSSLGGHPPLVPLTNAEELRDRLDRIGRVAAELVNQGDVVLLDSGSTVAEVAAQMPGSLRAPNAVTVVSHSLPVIEEVGSWQQPHLICLRGLFLPDHQASVGPMTLADLRELSADLAFIGCDGLTLEVGLTTPLMLIAEVGAAMAARARRVVAVADATKLGNAGFTLIVGIDAVHVLVTDERADPALVAELRRRGLEVLVV